VVPRKLDFRLKKDRLLRVAVYSRDKFSCQRCGAKAESPGATYDGRYTLTANNGEYLVLDHIIPRRAGGPNVVKNLQTLCDQCNRVKGSTADAAFDYKDIPGGNKS
jgi:5-methylcytosine-specific restriction endonuclease McrA